MKISHILYVILILMLLLATAQRIPSDVWWIRVSDFPHLQMTVLTAVVVIAIIAFVPGWPRIKQVLTVLGIIAILYQAYIIYPYTTLAPTMVEQADACSSSSLTILEANVYQKNREYGRFIEMVRNYDPDVVIALETDQSWTDTLQRALTNYPHVLKEPLDNTYGMILFSRVPFNNARIEYRINEKIPSFTLDFNLSRQVRMYVVHPRPPSPSKSDSTTQRDAELVLVGRDAKEVNSPVIVVGDFNDVAWSYNTGLFQRISGLLDPREGRGFYNTFDAGNVLLRYPLDYVFHSDDFQLMRLERTESIGSDHFPLYIELCLSPAEGSRENQEPEPADQEDHEEGSETVQKAKERDE